MTRFVTKAPPINNINSKCYTEKLKGSKTCLIGYSDFISREQYLIAQVVDTHRHRHTNTRTYRLPRQKQFQETRRAPGLKNHKILIVYLLNYMQ